MIIHVARSDRSAATNEKKRRKTFDEGKRNKISEENRNRMDSLILQSSFP